MTSEDGDVLAWAAGKVGGGQCETIKAYMRVAGMLEAVEAVEEGCLLNGHVKLTRRVCGSRRRLSGEVSSGR